MIKQQWCNNVIGKENEDGRRKSGVGRPKTEVKELKGVREGYRRTKTSIAQHTCHTKNTVGPYYFTAKVEVNEAS